MKKILIFSVAHHPFIGGAEIAVKEITDRLPEYEFDMVTLNLDGKQLPQEKVGNVMVYRIGGRGRIHKLLFPFSASRFAVTLHKTRNYDAIWSIMASFSGFAALFFKKKYPAVSFILTLQEGDPLYYIKYKVWLAYIWFKQIFTRADKVQAISTYLAKFAKDMGATAPTIVIPNGVDISHFSARFTDAELQSMINQLQKKPGDIFLITTSRLVEKNAIDDIIRALSYLPTEVKLLVLGEGHLRRKLQRLARGLGVSDRILFLGQVPHEQLPAYLAVSDIYVRPSLSEGMGNSFIEAMAVGLPVIATPVGGIIDFVRDPADYPGQATGLFCNVQDPESIVQKVIEIMGNQEMRHHIVSNARKMVEEKYSWDLIADKMRKEIFN